MRIQRIALVSSLALAVVVSGCGSVLQNPNADSGTDAGQDSGGVACRQLGEAACRARTDCAVGACSLCGGGASFVNCYDPTTESPPNCVGIACPALCSSLDEASCKTRTDCHVATCPDCNGGSRFAACLAANEDQICPAIACPAPCSLMTTKETCEARPDCHSVFVDGRDCACAALGCCARFSACAAGASAVCTPPATFTCTIAKPYCEGSYVVSYASGCYEGCVQSSDCALN